MSPVELILGIVIVVLAVSIAASVLLQSGKDSRMSGVISGAADTFLGKERGSRLDKVLNKVTPIVSGVFALVCIVLFLYVQ